MGRLRDATDKDAVVVVRRMSGGIGARVVQGLVIGLACFGAGMAYGGLRGRVAGGVVWQTLFSVTGVVVGVLLSYEEWVHVGRRELVKGVVILGVRFDFGWRAITREGEAVVVDEENGRVGVVLKKGKVEWFAGDAMLAEELRVAVGK